MVFKIIDPSRPVRIAFLGCGHAAELHSKTLSGFSKVKRYYASRIPDKAATFNKRFNGSGFFSDYSDAIESPDIDVVLILTPPDSHLDLSLEAIEAGKHVIVEKPPFLNSSDFDIVRESQRKTGVQVMVAENFFYKPALKFIREELEDGTIGEVKFIYLNAIKSQKTNNWRDDEMVAGGGALFEGGIHWINFMSNLGYQIKTIRGFLPGEHMGMDRSIQVVAKYMEGPIATLMYSWEASTILGGLRLSKIYGTRGSITFESDGTVIFVRGRKWKIAIPGLRDNSGYHAMFKDFISALRSGKEPNFSLSMARKDMELIEVILEDLEEEL